MLEQPRGIEADASGEEHADHDAELRHGLSVLYVDGHRHDLGILEDAFDVCRQGAAARLDEHPSAVFVHPPIGLPEANRVVEVRHQRFADPLRIGGEQVGGEGRVGANLRGAQDLAVVNGVDQLAPQVAQQRRVPGKVGQADRHDLLFAQLLADLFDLVEGPPDEHGVWRNVDGHVGVWLSVQASLDSLLPGGDEGHAAASQVVGRHVHAFPKLRHDIPLVVQYPGGRHGDEIAGA